MPTVLDSCLDPYRGKHVGDRPPGKPKYPTRPTTSTASMPRIGWSMSGAGAVPVGGWMVSMFTKETRCSWFPIIAGVDCRPNWAGFRDWCSGLTGGQSASSPVRAFMLSRRYSHGVKTDSSGSIARQITERRKAHEHGVLNGWSMMWSESCSRFGTSHRDKRASISAARPKASLRTPLRRPSRSGCWSWFPRSSRRPGLRNRFIALF